MTRHLLSLPGELRDNIYQYLDLPSHVTRTLHPEPNGPLTHVRHRGEWPAPDKAKNALHTFAWKLNREIRRLGGARGLRLVFDWRPGAGGGIVNIALTAAKRLDGGVCRCQRWMLRKALGADAFRGCDVVAAVRAILNEYARELSVGAQFVVSKQMRADLIAYCVRNCPVRLEMGTPSVSDVETWRVLVPTLRGKLCALQIGLVDPTLASAWGHREELINLPKLLAPLDTSHV